MDDQYSKKIVDISLSAKYNFKNDCERRTSMVEDESSSHVKDKAKLVFESLEMVIRKSVREYVARPKYLASDVKHHGVKVADEKICRRVLIGLASPGVTRCP